MHRQTANGRARCWSPLCDVRENSGLGARPHFGAKLTRCARPKSDIQDNLDLTGITSVLGVCDIRLACRYFSFDNTAAPAAESMPPMPLTRDSFTLGTCRAPHSPRNWRVASINGRRFICVTDTLGCFAGAANVDGLLGTVTRPVRARAHQRANRAIRRASVSEAHCAEYVDRRSSHAVQCATLIAPYAGCALNAQKSLHASGECVGLIRKQAVPRVFDPLD